MRTMLRYLPRKAAERLGILAGLAVSSLVATLIIRIPTDLRAAQEATKNPAVREELILQGSPAQMGRVYYDPAIRRVITVQANGGKQTLSGVPWASDYDIMGALNISADGRHVLHLAKRNGRMIVVLDGKETGEFDATMTYRETFSPDGQHVTLYAFDHNEYRIVVDGKTGPPGHGSDPSDIRIAYSPDSRRLAYVTTLPKDAKKLVVDGVEVTDCKSVDELLFSPDSQHWAAVVHRGFWRKTAVLLDGQDWVGGRLGGDLERVGGFEFNPATGELAMIGLGTSGDLIIRGVHQANKQKKYTFVRRPSGLEFPVWGPFFTTDGKHDVYTIGETRGFGADIYADGEIVWSNRIKGLPWNSTASWELGNVALSGDGRHLAVLVRDKNRIGVLLFLMAEDPSTGRLAAVAKREVEIPVPAGRGDVVTGRFMLSPSGQHFAFELSRSQFNFLVVDGEEGPQYEKFVQYGVEMKGCFFDTENSVTCLAPKPDGLYRVTQTAPAASPWPSTASY